MRLLGQLAAFGLIIVGATIGVGVATQDIGPPRQMAARSPMPAAAPDTKLVPLAARSTDSEAIAKSKRCDELAAHPDDPGRPKGVRGVDFDTITEPAAREAIDACGAALRLDAGNLRAQFNLGRAYQRIARLKPLESAEAWRRTGEAYTAAAKGGYAAAQGNLGQMLYGGTGGLAPDARQAVDWLRKSAAANFPDAYLTLAHAYATGRGVDQADARTSFCWLTLVERTSSVRAYRTFAQQQRAAMVLGAAEKRAVEHSAAKGADCL
jgi:TPR repeat protein